MSGEQGFGWQTRRQLSVIPGHTEIVRRECSQSPRLEKHGELARSFCRRKVKVQGALSPLHARPQIGLHEDTFMTRVRVDCTQPT